MKTMPVNDVLSSPPQSFARCPKQNENPCAAPGKCLCCLMESSQLTRRVGSEANRPEIERYVRASILSLEAQPYEARCAARRSFLYPLVSLGLRALHFS